MIEMIDSTGTIAGIFYDFRGCEALIGFGGLIIKVTCLKTGKDLTYDFKRKYGQN